MCLNNADLNRRLETAYDAATCKRSVLLQLLGYAQTRFLMGLPMSFDMRPESPLPPPHDMSGFPNVPKMFRMALDDSWIDPGLPKHVKTCEVVFSDILLNMVCD